MPSKPPFRPFSSDTPVQRPNSLMQASPDGHQRHENLAFERIDGPGEKRQRADDGFFIKRVEAHRLLEEIPDAAEFSRQRIGRVAVVRWISIDRPRRADADGDDGQRQDRSVRAPRVAERAGIEMRRFAIDPFFKPRPDRRADERQQHRAGGQHDRAAPASPTDFRADGARRACAARRRTPAAPGGSCRTPLAARRWRPAGTGRCRRARFLALCRMASLLQNPENTNGNPDSAIMPTA